MRQADATRRQRHRRPRFYALTAVGAIIAIVVLAIIIDSALYHNKIHAGVNISGISMGGSTRDDAAAQLNKLVEQAQNSKITLTDGERTWSVLPTDMGTKMDVAGAVSAAMEASRKSNFIVDLGHKLKLYFSSVDIPLTGTIDSAMTDKVLNDLSAQIDTTPVNAGLTLENGQVKVIEGQKGQVVDKDKLREELESLVLSLHSTELTIPLKEQDPAIQAQDTQDAVNQANTMLSAPVALTSGKKSWSITTDQIASYLGFTTQMVNGVSTLVPFLAADKMQPFFDQIASEVATEPVDAKIKTDGKKAWVEPGVPGKKLDPVKTAEAVSQAALQTSGRTMEVAVTTVDPDLTTAEAEAMGVKDLLSSYTTPPYVGTANRQINVRITTEYASDVLLAPGEIYNFDKQIGPRTAARGYKTAPGIVGPGKLEDVFGGGICQVSTTLFNAAFFAGLEIVERKNHSI
ncbi:MAG: peptidoglycan binding domain-containing protein, partial [Actinobacteria bacterium]|nr:peptidoglycan binding domain-containing protein [Actinomycetota bacterium]